MQVALAKKLGKITRGSGTGFGAAVSQPEVLDPPRLATLQKAELGTSLADANRRGKFLTVRDDIQKLEGELFIADNRAALSAFNAKLTA